MNVVLGIALLALGVAIIAYSGQISHAFWRWEWADRHLGGTTQWYVLIGVVVIVISIVVMFWWAKDMSTDISGAQLGAPNQIQ